MKVNENNEMKSHYVKPAVRVIDVQCESIIAESGFFDPDDDIDPKNR